MMRHGCSGRTNETIAEMIDLVTSLQANVAAIRSSAHDRARVMERADECEVHLDRLAQLSRALAVAGYPPAGTDRRTNLSRAASEAADWLASAAPDNVVVEAVSDTNTSARAEPVNVVHGITILGLGLLEYATGEPHARIHVAVGRSAGEAGMESRVDLILELPDGPHARPDDAVAIEEALAGSVSVVRYFLTEAGGEVVVAPGTAGGVIVSLRLPGIEETPVPRVLFVDDEEATTELAAISLERLGCDFRVVTNPLEALAILRDRRSGFDVLITDYLMPELTGDQLAREAKASAPGIRVVIATGNTQSYSERDAMADGNGFLPKPFTLAELESAIARDRDPVTAGTNVPRYATNGAAGDRGVRSGQPQVHVKE